MVSIRRKALLKAILVNHLIKKRKRQYWVHPLNQQRGQDGEHLKIEEMYNKYPDRFFEYTRLTPTLFDKLLSIVGSSIEMQNTPYRESIPCRIRLFIILRYLATGDSLRTISTNFSVGTSTVWNILRFGLPIIWKLLKNEYVARPTVEAWAEIATGFENKWNYPNCLGAIDGKHVVMCAPRNSGSLYLNYKGTFSIVLLATCDANYKFTTVDVGGYGKQSDGGVFACSKLGAQLKNGTLQIPASRRLTETSSDIQYHFIGDEAFPLTLYMMRPYSGKNLNDSCRIFNYRLSRARRCIENAFGIMSARFRIFRRPIPTSPKNAEMIVLASVALHNFIIQEEQKVPVAQRIYNPPGFADGNDEDNGVWRRCEPAYALADVPTISMAAHERLSKKMRDDLNFYFNNSGRVPWQNQSVGLI